MAGPPLPRNSELVKDGQGSQPLMRFLDQVKSRAYSAIQSFNEFFQLDTIGEAVDTANDYLLIYNASTGAAEKIAVENVAASGLVQIESWTVTASSQKVFSSIPQTYSGLLLVVSGVRRSAAVSSLVNVEVSDDGGSTYASAVGQRTAISALSTATPSIATLPVSTIPIAYVRDGSFLTTAVFQLENYAGGSSTPKFFSGSGGVTNWGAASEIGSVSIGGVIAGVGAIDTLKLSLASGTFSATGTATLYGIK